MKTMKQILISMLALMASLAVMGQEYSVELERRAQNGDVKAQYDMYQCLLYGAVNEQNYDDVMSWLIKSAEGGYAPAQYEMGKLCLVEPSIEDTTLTEVQAAIDAVVDRAVYYTAEGLEWMRKSAEQNFMQAIIEMGDIYFDGLGVPQSDSEALKWYQRALGNGLDDEDEIIRIKRRIEAIQGDSEALLEMGDIKHVRQAADKGYLPALQYLGDFYSNVDRREDLSFSGEPIGNLHFVLRDDHYKNADYAQALKYYKLAAKQGDVLSSQRASLIEAMLSGDLAAAYELCGLTYIDDIDIDSTYHVVDDGLLRKIANQGYGPAQYTLASYLDDQDDEEAELWLRKAAEQDYEDAQTLLAYYYLGKNRYNEAIQAFKIALDHDSDDLDATMGLGRSYYSQGMYIEAIPWLEIVAASDDEDYASDAALLLGVSHYNLKHIPQVIKCLHGISDISDCKAEADYWIGMCYIDEASPVNYVEAMRWFIEADNGPSNYQIGRMYMNGNGVQQSQSEAINYFRKALDAYGVAVIGKNDVFEFRYGFSPAVEMLIELGREDIVQEYSYLIDQVNEDS